MPLEVSTVPAVSPESGEVRPVRVRLAPSPTGYLHIGHAFLAVLDAAFAAKTGGKFIIRIEDTDRERFVPEAEQAIYSGLRYLGLQWDEGPDVGGPFAPYRQSERLERYHAATEDLIARGRAYRCWCSPERLDLMRKEQQARKQPPRYDRLCLGKTEAERRLSSGYTERSVVRLLMPSDGQTVFQDLIRGPISFDNRLLDDRVLLKSDGFPTYNLAAPFDDHAMQITHILRGEEWIPSTPAHLQLFDAMGWELPTIVHTPLLLNIDRSKISKRKHAWAKVSWFEDEGFLPEATLNYLGGLAVHVPDPENSDSSVDRDLFGFQEIMDHLDLARIGPSGKVLDLDRLDWLNGQYLRRLPLAELEQKVRPFMIAAGIPIDDSQRLSGALALEQERIKRLAEAPRVLSFFFRDEEYDAQLLLPRGLDRPRALEYLGHARQIVDEVAAGVFAAVALEARFQALAAQLGLMTGKERGQLYMVVRVAVTGRAATPPLFETMEVLGAETVHRRLDIAIAQLQRAATGNRSEQ